MCRAPPGKIESPRCPRRSHRETRRFLGFGGGKFGDLFGWFFFSIILYFASLIIIGEIEGNDNYLFRRLKIVNKNDRAKISLSFV